MPLPLLLGSPGGQPEPEAAKAGDQAWPQPVGVPPQGSLGRRPQGSWPAQLTKPPDWPGGLIAAICCHLHVAAVTSPPVVEELRQDFLPPLLLPHPFPILHPLVEETAVSSPLFSWRIWGSPELGSISAWFSLCLSKLSQQTEVGGAFARHDELLPGQQPVRTGPPAAGTECGAAQLPRLPRG